MRMGSIRLAFVLVPLFGLMLAPAQAEDEARSRLLVNCRAADVPAVLKALASLDVEVHDLETMLELASRSPAAVAAESPAPAAQAAPSTRLVDAAAAWRALYAVFGHYRGEDGVPWARITRLDIRPKGIQATLVVSDLEVLERLRSSILGHAFFAARSMGAAQVQWGTSREVEGGWRTDLMVSLPQEPTDGSAGAGAEPLEHISAATVQQAARTQRLQMIYASREKARKGPAGAILEQRFEFEVPSIEAMHAFLGAVGEKTGTTVIEARWTLKPKRPDAPYRLEITLATRGRSQE